MLSKYIGPDAGISDSKTQPNRSKFFFDISKIIKKNTFLTKHLYYFKEVGN